MTSVERAVVVEVRRRRRISWNRVRLLLLGGFFVVIFFLCAVFAPLIAPYSPYSLNVAHMLEAPSWTHLLGTDQLGRDVLSRVIFAARISVKVGTIAVAIGLIGGTIIGLFSAYFGGVMDMVLMRLMELLFSFPAILLAIVLMAAFGTNIFNAMLAIGIIFIPGFSRLARAAAHDILRQQYIEAARTIGMSDVRILFREILPNVLTPQLVEAAIAFAYAVLLESALSFLGLGAQPPDPSWGNMLSEGRGFMGDAPWLGIVPGLALFFCVLGFNLLGDGLRDFLDPHLRD